MAMKTARVGINHVDPKLELAANLKQAAWCFPEKLPGVRSDSTAIKCNSST